MCRFLHLLYILKTTTKVLLGSTLLVVYRSKDKIPLTSGLLQGFLQGGIVGYVVYSLTTWQQQQQQNEATSNVVNIQEKEEETTATAEASNE